MTQLAFDFAELMGPTEPVGPFVCSYCGEESATVFAHDLNHAPLTGMCATASLRYAHCVAITRRVPRAAGQPANCFAEQCPDHYRSEWVRRLPEACLRREWNENMTWLTKIGAPVEDIPAPPWAMKEKNDDS